MMCLVSLLLTHGIRLSLYAEGDELRGDTAGLCVLVIIIFQR